MAQREIYSKIRSLRHVAAAVIAATVNPTGVDTQGFGSVGFSSNIGVAGISLSGTNKITLVMEESDDNTTFTAVAAADAVGGLNSITLDASAKANQNYRQDYIGNKRYVRLNPTFAGTHGTGTPIAVTALMGHASLAPVTHG